MELKFDVSDQIFAEDKVLHYFCNVQN